MDNDWLTAVIAKGFAKLLVLRLVGAPAADPQSLEALIGVWKEALGTMVEARDAPRIAAGFQKMLATARKWPYPADLLDHMPPIPVDSIIEHREKTEEERAIARFWLKEIKAILEPSEGATKKTSTTAEIEERRRAFQQLAIKEP